jgi:hypothetical protein
LNRIAPCTVALALLALPHGAIGDSISNPLTPLSLHAKVIDADTQQAIPRVWLLARETAFTDIQITHSGVSRRQECFRGAFGRTRQDGTADIDLPAAGLTGAQEFSSTAEVGWLSYAPHYCAAGKGNLRDGPHDQLPGEMQGSGIRQMNEAAGPYAPTEMRMQKSQDRGEYRILYLIAIATSLSCKLDYWPTDTPDMRRRFIDQLVDEATAEAVSDYDRTLVARLRTLGEAATRGDPLPKKTLQVITITHSADQREERRQCIADIADTVKQQLTPAELTGVCRAIGWSSAAACRPALAAQCDPNSRYGNGETTLSAEFKSARESHGRQNEDELTYIKALLIFGADPNIAPRPGEPTLLDVLLQISQFTRTEEQEWRLRVLELLANDGRATILPQHRTQLEKREEKWSSDSGINKAFYRRARELTRPLSLRTEFAPSCKLPAQERPSGLPL